MYSNYTHLSPPWTPLHHVIFCCYSRHKAPGMVDIVSRRCKHPQCVRRPLYAVPGQRAVLCRIHKEPGMKDVVSRRCDYEVNPVQKPRPGRDAQTYLLSAHVWLSGQLRGTFLYQTSNEKSWFRAEARRKYTIIYLFIYVYIIRTGYVRESLGGNSVVETEPRH